jgi:hypothetical protein
MANSDKKKIELPRDRIWINLEFSTEEGLKIVRTKLGIFDQPAQESKRNDGGSIEQPLEVLSTNRSLNNLKSVMLEAVSDLLKLGYVITGAPWFEEWTDRGTKRRIRIWFSKPEDLGRTDPDGNEIKRFEAMETRLVAFLKETYATYVHVKDDNADGGSCIIAIALKPLDGSPTQSLRFREVTPNEFTFLLEEAELQGTPVESPRRAGLVTFGEMMQERLGRKSGAA